MRTILVTGSRDWVNPVRVRDALCRYGLETPEQNKLIHGDARGLDRIAAREAHKLGWTVHGEPADWDRYGRARAGRLRNQVMVDMGADFCLAFPLATSVGTFDCAARAWRAGIQVVFIRDDSISKAFCDQQFAKAARYM